MEGWGSAFPARHRKASSEAEPLQPEGTSLEVIPHHVSQPGVVRRAGRELGGRRGGGGWGVHLPYLVHCHSQAQH
uniref:Uncharacterized protein n=1 Tax=Physcomitrium patens TaxID=3218 RepID=A0A2K1IB62_PHYPA|nr:hypothetical protein PHYPA_030013 [Physcomitrium patens]